MSIVFKKHTGESALILAKFIMTGIEHPFIEFEFDFNNEAFKAKLTLEAELSDLEGLLRGLIYLNDNLKGTFYFEPISERVKIKFEINDLGHMQVDGIVYSESYSTTMSFKFLSDQSFLSELISQCRVTISSLKE